MLCFTVLMTIIMIPVCFFIGIIDLVLGLFVSSDEDE